MKITAAIICFCLSAFVTAQQPSIVVYNGENHFVYPIKADADPSSTYLEKYELTSLSFQLYRNWRQSGDVRYQLKRKKLKRALYLELVTQKLINPSQKVSKKYYGKVNYRGKISLRRRFRRCIQKIGRFRIPLNREQALLKVNKDAWLDQANVLGEELTPTLQVLPDGKYVQHYDDMYFGRNLYRSKIESGHVAAVFSLKNGILDGDYVRFSYAGDTIQSGAFKAGLRQGDWYLTKDNFAYISAERRFLFKRHIIKKKADAVWTHFEDGKLNGDFLQIKSDGDTIRGRFKDNLCIGKWHFKNGYSNRSFDVFDFADTMNFKDRCTNYFGSFMFQNFEDDSLFHGEKLTSKVDMRLRPLVVSSAFTPRISGLFSATPHTLHYTDLVRRSQSKVELDSELFQGELNRTQSTFTGFERPNFASFYQSLDTKTGNVLAHYEIDNKHHIVIGQRNYKNGQVLEKVFVDEANQCVVFELYTAHNKLYLTRKWNFQGKEIQREFHLNRSTTFATDTFQGYPVIKNKRFIYLTDDALAQLNGEVAIDITWFRKSEKLIFARVYNKSMTEIKECYYAANGELSMIKSRPFLPAELQIRKALDSIKGLPNEAILRDSILPSNINNALNSKYLFETVYVKWGNGAFVKTTDSIIKLKYHDQDYSGKIVFVNSKNVGLNETVPGQLIFSHPFSEGWGKIAQKSSSKSVSFPFDQSRFLQDDYLLFVNKLFVSSIFKINISRISGEMLNGVPQGNWQFFDKKNELLYELIYDQGKATGEVKRLMVHNKDDFYWIRFAKRNPEYAEYNPVSRKKNYYVGSVTPYKNGKLDGQYVELNFKQDTTSLLHFENDQLEGKQFLRQHDVFYYGEYSQNRLNGEKLVVELKGDYRNGKKYPRLDTLIHAKYANDRLNGRAILNLESGRSEMVFKNDLLVDSLTQFDEGILKEKVFFKDSVLVQQQIYSNGILSYSRNYDTIYHLKYPTSYLRNCLNRHSLYRLSLQIAGNRFTENKEWLATVSNVFTKYYPNGNVARTGPQTNEVACGRWEYYNYAGQKLYTIDFQDSVLELGSDSIPIFGSYQAFDTLGVLIRTGFVTEREEKYNCSSDDYYAVQQFILTNVNGKEVPAEMDVTYYFDTGAKMSSGHLKNGVPVGVWLFYTPDGKLAQVGAYENGLRAGRWLKGDLGEKAYIGDVCMNPNDPFLDYKIAQLERELDISVVIYKKGKIQVDQVYSIQK